MDPNLKFIEMHSRHFVDSRLASASTYRYGNASPLAAIIGAIAAGVRRFAATIEGWARGTNTNVVAERLPRLNSAR